MRIPTSDSPEDHPTPPAESSGDARPRYAASDRTRLERALAHCSGAGDRPGMAAALDGLAEIAESEGDMEPARILRQEAAALRDAASGTLDVEASPAPVHHETSGRGAESTATLIALTQSGDERARNRLAARYLEALKKFAHRRLPARARDDMDTDDLVQVTIQRVLTHLRDFKPRREGAFLAYLRRALVNRVRDEIRRVARRPGRQPLTDALPDPGPSPLQQAAEQEMMDRYEASLGRLSDEQRAAVMLHLEADMSFPEVARALGKSSPDAARMLFRRGADRMSALMGEIPGT